MRLRRPVVLLLCALAVLLCLARTGEGSVLGLDLGTEYFKGVLAKTGVPMEIVLNRETKRKTATVVGIADGQRFFGEDALAMKTKAPQDTFADLLGLLGRKFDDPVSQLYRGKYPNKMVSDPERGTVAFELTNGDVYRVEELVGMILMHAKDQAEAMGEEKVDGAVITVPPYFDQSERMALLDAARIAHLRVFSLMNVDTAAALNFGMTKKFDARQKHIFYDIGAGSTKVSLVSFGTRQVKEKSKFSTKPRSVNVTQFEVEAVAFNRELNGRELDFCLQDILAQRFQKQKGVTENVHQNKRAMAKILKEAQRVKAVLSVNSETMARIEGAMNDVDLVQRINRKDFEETCASVLDRAVEPLKELIEKNQLSLSEIDSVTLMGGGTRVPRIQALLKEYLQRELGQNLNTDEAAVFGAAFRAATLSKRFQVKDIRVKDITPYTVGLRYVSDADTNEDGEVEEAGVKDFKIFKRNTHQNTKKQVTFRKSSDFDFEITYSDDEQIDKHSGNGKVMDVFVEGFSSDKYQAAMGKLQSGDHPKISVTVDMDESGVISIEKAEATFTYTVIQEKEDPTKKGDKKESFSDKFFNFFSGKKADGAKGEGEQESEEAPTEPEQPQGEEPAKEPREGEEQEAPKTEQGEEPSKEQNAPEQEAKQEEAGQPSEEAPKEKEMVEVQKTDRVRLRAKVNPAFKTLTDDRLEEIGARINKMIEHETKLRERVEALNALEAFTYAKREFLELADVIKVSTEEERQKLSAALSEASDWLYSEGFEATTEVLKEKMKSLLAIESPISFRHKEYTQRDETFGKLKALISLGKEAVKNISSLAEEARAQTSEDIEKAMKVIQEVETWVEETLKLQSAKKLFENPVATIEDILKKGSTLRTDLEKFMKKIKPKPKVEKDKPKAKAKKEAKKEAEEEAEEGERLEEEYEQEQREQQEQQEQEQEQQEQQEQQEEQEEQGQENGHGEDHQHEEL